MINPKSGGESIEPKRNNNNTGKKFVAGMIAAFTLVGCSGQSIEATPGRSPVNTNTIPQAPESNPSSSSEATPSIEAIDYEDKLTPEQLAMMSPAELEKYATLPKELIDDPTELLEQYYKKIDSLIMAGSTSDELEGFWHQSYNNGERWFLAYWYNSKYGSAIDRIDATASELITDCREARQCDGLAGTMMLQQLRVNLNEFYGENVPVLGITERQIDVIGSSVDEENGTISIDYQTSERNDLSDEDLQKILNQLPDGSEINIFDGETRFISSKFVLNSSVGSVQLVSTNVSAS